jgi:hypothetical protein
MISRDTEFRLIQTVTSQKIGEEIAARLAVSVTPSTADDAQDILDILDPRSNKSIAERLNEDLSGDGDGSAGTELARKINGMVKVLQAKANGIGQPAQAAHFTGQVTGMTTDVTITSAHTGTIGNSVALLFDGIKTITTVISDWNTAHPTNTVTLTAGSGSQVPANSQEIDLSGGHVDTDNDLSAAKSAMGNQHMSNAHFEVLVDALADRASAKDFRKAYNTMVDSIYATVLGA